MFGNRLGWGISFGIMVATWAFLVLVLGRATGVPPPTELGRNAADYAIEFPIDPVSLAYWMTGEGNSGPIYQDALNEYRTRQSAHDQVKSAEEAQQLKKGMDLLIQAGKCKAGGVFSGNPAQVINYDSERVNLEAAKALARSAAAVAKYAGDAGKLDEARALYEAIFSLGAKMYQERLTYYELDYASEPLELGARGLAKLDDDAGEHARANKYKTFSQTRVQYITDNVIRVRNGVWALDPHVGDMIEIANRGGDPMWRVDAILALGRANVADQTKGLQYTSVRHQLEQFAESTEPRVRVAAQSALDLTIEQFRRLK